MVVRSKGYRDVSFSTKNQSAANNSKDLKKTVDKVGLTSYTTAASFFPKPGKPKACLFGDTLQNKDFLSS